MSASQRLHPPPLSPSARQQLRQQLRQARRALSRQQQQRAGQALAYWLQRLPWRHNTRIGAYVAHDGEIDPARFLARLSIRHVCYPVLDDRHPQKVRLVPARPPGRQDWRPNRYGIPEPVRGRARPAWTLHALLLPLVGFTTAGDRLGMGGGYYDRLLASFRRRPRRPLLIGLAHELQALAQLPTAAWDQPVDVIVTDRRIIRAN